MLVPDQDEEGATNTFSSSPKVISTRSLLQDHPPPSFLGVPPFSSASGLQSFHVQALTLPLPTCQEAGKPEDRFDHSRSLITVDEYANEAATLTPPSSPQDQLRGSEAPQGQDHLGVDKARRRWAVGPSQITLPFTLSSSPGKVPGRLSDSGERGYRERKRP